tara:strand:+ start:404 stop:556 length:153 start_codon:yes stop_codon:yes gene_type:complete
MAKTYKLYDLPTGIILKPDENMSIPPDPKNTDYQEYLEWVAAGNTADAAD